MTPVTRLAAIAAVAVLLAAVVDAQTASTADVLQQLKRIDRAMADDAVGTPDPQAVAAQQAEKATLVKQLIAAPQQSPETIKFLGDRWRGMMMSHTPGIAAELDEAIRDAKSDDVAAEAYVAKINMTQFAAKGRGEAYAAVKPIADAFVARVPDSKYVSGLYGVLAGIAPDATTEVDFLKKAIATSKSPQDSAPAEARLKELSIVGKPIDLQFTDAIAGRPISLAGLKGKVVVLDFWATWCGPCVAEMPTMKKLYADFKDRGVEFIGVSLDNPPEDGGLTKLRDFVKKNEIAWPQYYQGKGWDADFSSGLGVMGVPTVFVIGKDGNVVTTDGRGKLETLLPTLLGEAAATQPAAR